MGINLKRVRTKCIVKGCRNSGAKVDTFNVSASREFGRGVIMCEECIKGAYEALMTMHSAVVRTSADAEAEAKVKADEKAIVQTASAEETAEKTKKRSTRKAQ
ncbi:MAG: hypothetical protein ACI3XA_04670 [Clostridia bacterium]